MAAATVFSLAGSLLTAIGVGSALFLFARWATARDPKTLRLVINTMHQRIRYDAAKYEGTSNFTFPTGGKRR